MWIKLGLATLGVYLLGAAAWLISAGVVRDSGGVELLNVACDPTRELWHDLNESFIRDHEAKHGVRLTINQSHGGSAAQAQAVASGLDADVVTLGLWLDTDTVRRAGLIEDGWEERLPNRSLPYVSTIVFVVRKGNEKRIKDWADLARPDVAVITPDPKTSGNGKWSFAALWGSVVWRGGTDAEARAFVAGVYRRAPNLDRSARAATMTFATKKIGDVHLTWENEAYLEVEEAKGALEIVYPGRPGERPLSVLAEPHVAVVDRNADRKGTRPAAEAYLKYLYTPAAQDLIARHHHRPTDPAAVERHRGRFPDVELRRATSLVPGGTWDELNRAFFAEGGEFDRIYDGGKR